MFISISFNQKMNVRNNIQKHFKMKHHANNHCKLAVIFMLPILWCEWNN